MNSAKTFATSNQPAILSVLIEDRNTRQHLQEDQAVDIPESQPNTQDDSVLRTLEAFVDEMKQKGFRVSEPGVPVRVHIEGLERRSGPESQNSTQERFIKTGLSHYIATRFAVFAGLAPIHGNQAHHAIELLLKAKLSETYSLQRLKKEIRHDVCLAWQAFKRLFPADDFSDFDELVGDIARFEEIRYPDKFASERPVIIASHEVGTDQPSVTVRATDESFVYQFHLNKLDSLIRRIFDLCGWKLSAHSSGFNDVAWGSFLADNKSWSLEDIERAG